MGSRPSKVRRGSSAHAVLLDTEESTALMTMGEFNTDFRNAALDVYKSNSEARSDVRMDSRLYVLLTVATVAFSGALLALVYKGKPFSSTL